MAPTPELSPDARVMDGRRRVGVLYHPKVEASHALAEELVEALDAAGAQPTLLSSWDEAAITPRLQDLDWMVALGGDGTVLRTARLTAAAGVPIVGVNFGRLGFLAAIEPDEAVERVTRLLYGDGALEERLMLRCRATIGGQTVGPLDAVNDVFVGRGRVARAVRLTTVVDGAVLHRFAADGLIAATPTGSTAYTLSSGGPVVAPELNVIVLTPVVPHPAPIHSVVLQEDARLEITVDTDEDAVLSVDGQQHHELRDGDHVAVTAAPYRARFLRLGRRERFYSTLVERLRRW